MGIFSGIRKLFSKKNNIDDIELDCLNLNIRSYDKSGDVDATIVSDCEQIVDITYQMEDLKLEYELVTSYFTDIQKIEELPGMHRKEIEDIARKILSLEKNRVEFLQSETRLSDEKFKNIQSLEGNIKDIMGKLGECENRDMLIRRDMQKLEAEKAAIEYEEESTEDRIYNLRNIIKVVFVIMCITFLGILIVGYMSSTNVTIPMMIVLFIAAAFAVFGFVCYKQMEADRKLDGLRHNRAIELLNKVKIKYINNTNTLDYMYEKYKVNSLKELEYMWDQYIIMVDEIKRYQKSTGDLRVYTDELTKLLYNLGIKDPDIWTKQAIALLDNREMVEVKHSLNVRRQRLREQLEYNEKIKINCLDEIQEIIKEYPDKKSQVKNALATYHIEL